MVQKLESIFTYLEFLIKRRTYFMTKQVLAKFVLSSVLIFASLSAEEGASLEQEILNQKMHSMLSTQNRYQGQSEEELESPPFKEKLAANVMSTLDLVASSSYSTDYTSHPGAYHRIYDMTFMGDLIELDDGSIWEVCFDDLYKSSYWRLDEKIVITPNHNWFSSHEFVLTNKVTGEAVEVDLVRESTEHLESRYILAIDYKYHTLFLDDLSTWDISAFDDAIMREWRVKHSIIIGVNDGWMSTTRPNILINGHTRTYARGVCSY